MKDVFAPKFYSLIQNNLGWNSRYKYLATFRSSFPSSRCDLGRHWRHVTKFSPIFPLTLYCIAFLISVHLSRLMSVHILLTQNNIGSNIFDGLNFVACEQIITNFDVTGISLTWSQCLWRHLASPAWHAMSELPWTRPCHNPRSWLRSPGRPLSTSSSCIHLVAENAKTTWCTMCTGLKLWINKTVETICTLKALESFCKKKCQVVHWCELEVTRWLLYHYVVWAIKISFNLRYLYDKVAKLEVSIPVSSYHYVYVCTLLFFYKISIKWDFASMINNFQFMKKSLLLEVIIKIWWNFDYSFGFLKKKYKRFTLKKSNIWL